MTPPLPSGVACAWETERQHFGPVAASRLTAALGKFVASLRPREVEHLASWIEAGKLRPLASGLLAAGVEADEALERQRSLLETPAPPPGVSWLTFRREWRIRVMTTPEWGLVGGRHYSTFGNDVAALKRDNRITEAEALLLRLVDATEREAAEKRDRLGPHARWRLAPAWYVELAMLYRKQRRYVDEVGILTRFLSHPSGIDNGTLTARLARARDLARQAPAAL